MIEAVIICGGMGTRLKSLVPDTQKVVAKVQGRPFIFFIIDELVKQKIDKFVLCLGYKSEDVISLIEEEYANKNVTIDYSVEAYPLGTGGAINLAQTHCTGDDILVLNGDTFNSFSIQGFLNFHKYEKNKVSMLVKSVAYVSRYGSVILDSENNVTSFLEKDTTSVASGLINVGAYILSKEILVICNKDVFSLEKDLLPKVIGKGFKALQSNGTFIDIGVPEDFQKANKIQLETKL